MLGCKSSSECDSTSWELSFCHSGNYSSNPHPWSPSLDGMFPLLCLLRSGSLTKTPRKFRGVSTVFFVGRVRARVWRKWRIWQMHSRPWGGTGGGSSWPKWEHLGNSHLQSFGTNLASCFFQRCCLKCFSLRGVTCVTSERGNRSDLGKFLENGTLRGYWETSERCILWLILQYQGSSQRLPGVLSKTLRDPKAFSEPLRPVVPLSFSGPEGVPTPKTTLPNQQCKGVPMAPGSRVSNKCPKTPPMS